MKQYGIAGKLASTMQQEGCVLDACDRLIASQIYRRRKPDKPRR